MRYYDTIKNESVEGGKEIEEYFGVVVVDRERYKSDGVPMPLQPVRVRGLEGMRVLRRLDVDVTSEEKLNGRAVLSLGKNYDIVGIRLPSPLLLEKCSSFKVDVISLDLSREVFEVKKGVVGKMMASGVYVELVLSEGISSGSKHIWMSNMYEMLRAVKSSRIIVSTGAAHSYELRTPREIETILSGFGDGRRANKYISINPEEMIRRCALRKYAFRNCVFTAEDEGPLKSLIREGAISSRSETTQTK
jgi:RNase P/RNase MRP subunit p30